MSAVNWREVERVRCLRMSHRKRCRVIMPGDEYDVVDYNPTRQLLGLRVAGLKRAVPVAITDPRGQPQFEPVQPQRAAT